jgi:hypothetical protein
MVIVLISWRIKPTDDAVEQFKAWWRDHANVDDRSGLFGEFLSSPVPADELPFETDDMRVPHGEYRPFVNVGLWRDVEAFQTQIVKNFSDDKPPHPFEAERRRRTVLVPDERRMGAWTITDT